jgi:hypothetical protein
MYDRKTFTFNLTLAPVLYKGRDTAQENQSDVASLEWTRLHNLGDLAHLFKF